MNLGTDIIEISRIVKNLRRKAFLQRVYTIAERSYLEKQGKNAAQSAAGFFCAKEACAKALGTGFGADLSFCDVEVLHNQNGKPFLKVKGRERPDLLLSISHCQDYAVATVLSCEAAYE